VAADRFTVIDAVNKCQQRPLISTVLASWRIAGSRTAARLASHRTTERPPSQLNRDANIQLEVRASSNLCTTVLSLLEPSTYADRISRMRARLFHIVYVTMVAAAMAGWTWLIFNGVEWLVG
jgi:hypothetical protein